MKLNSLIPELAVKDLGKSRHFYKKILPFKLWYERKEFFKWMTGGKLANWNIRSVGE